MYKRLYLSKKKMRFKTFYLAKSKKVNIFVLFIKLDIYKFINGSNLWNRKQKLRNRLEKKT